jgi:hypothetical protein
VVASALVLRQDLTCSTDQVAIEIQSMGLTPGICASDGEVSQALRDCTLCINAKQFNANASADFLDLPVFQAYLDYCSTVAASNSTLIAEGQSLLAQYYGNLSSIAAASSSVAALESQLISQGLLTLTTSTSSALNTGEISPM